MCNGAEVLFKVVFNSGSKFAVVGKMKYLQRLALSPFMKVSRVKLRGPMLHLKDKVYKVMELTR